MNLSHMPFHRSKAIDTLTLSSINLLTLQSLIAFMKRSFFPNAGRSIPILQIMRSHLARSPDPAPIIVQHEWNRNERNAQEPEQAACPVDA